MIARNAGIFTRHPLPCQHFLLTKPKSVKQVFREGLKHARLRLAGVRGHYVTPEEIGKDVGVSGQTIRNYESGASEPSLDMIDKLGAVLQVPLAWPPFHGLGPAVELPQEGATGLPVEEGQERPVRSKRSTRKQKGER